MPDEIAQQAHSAGLLCPDAIERYLRKAMKKRQVHRFFATVDTPATSEPALTEEEIDAELAAARATGRVVSDTSALTSCRARRVNVIRRGSN